MTKEYQELLDKVYKDAFEYERKYGFCPQAVLAAVQDYFGIVDDEVIKAFHTLAGGGALCGDGTCGGLAGGMAAVSCKFGRSRVEFDKGEISDWLKSSKIAREIREKFIGEFGSVICNDVQTKKMGRSFDIWDPVDFQKFEEAGAHEDKCPDVTGKVARWTAESLIKEGVLPVKE